MKYTYNLTNPIDYLRILFAVFFDLSAFPLAENPREQIVLVAQGLITIILTNGLIGWLTNWGKNWQLLLFGVVCGMIDGIVIGTVVGTDDGTAHGVKYGIKFSVGFGIMIGIAICLMEGGVGLGIGIGVIIATAATAEFGVVEAGRSDIILGLSFGITFNIVFCLVSIMVKTGSIMWNFFSLLIIALLACIPAIFVGLFLAEILPLILEFIFKSRTVATSLLRELVLLFVLCVGIGYLFKELTITNWPSTFNYCFNEYQPLRIAIILFLVFSRLLLWPFEIVFALVGMLFVRVNLQKEPEQFFQKIRNWYFDCHTLLPLPGEARILSYLSTLDWNYGIWRTIGLAQHSGHLFQAVNALRSFAIPDPYGVQTHIRRIGKKAVCERLLQYIFHHQPEHVCRAYKAYESLIDLSTKLLPTNEQAKQHPIFLRYVNGLPEHPKDINLQKVHSKLHQAVEDMELANKLAGQQTLLYGTEMVTLYSGLHTGLGWNNVKKLAEFHAPKLSGTEAPHLFSQGLVDILSGMDALAQMIQGYVQATSQVTKQQALLQANEQIVRLREQVKKVPQPAGSIVAFVLAHWQRLIATGGGESVRTQNTMPVDNPYIAGNPVRGSLFVGREDILSRLEELWTGGGQKPSIVLYGHRRMGKSSILQNLGGRFGFENIIVDFNMQGQRLTANTSELLYNLALEIYDEFMQRSPQAELAEPTEEQFSHHPANSFKRFLKQLDAVLGEFRFIVTVDEFELVEQMIREGKIEAGLLDFWRSLIQTYPWFVMALAGLHTLQEMTANYWHPLYASVIAIQVSFLRPKAARRLITQPSPDFPIDYDQDAIETIIALTNGQPYLVQLICHGLVTRFNRQMFEEGKEREHRFSLSDMEAVIQAPDFFRDGNAYFTGVWIQAKESDPPTQITVLQALAPSKNGLSLDTLIQKTEFSDEEVKHALESLKRHDVVKEEDGHWRFTVELMRRWVAQKS